MSTLPEITEVKEDDHDDDENKKSPVENESSKHDSTNINPQNQDQNSQKKSSCLPIFFTSQPKKSTLKAPAENQASTTATTSTYSSIGEMSRSISADIKYITDEYQKLDKYKDSLQSQLAELSERLELLKNEGNDKEFQNLQKEVTKLKFQIPSKHKGDVEEKDPHKRQLTKNKPKTIPEKVMQQMPQLYKHIVFENCSEYTDLVSLFNSLPVELKLCLLCFAVFPENAIIKKRLMVYWWIAEGFVPPILHDSEIKRQIEKGRTAEEFAGDYFEKLTKMGFVVPVNKKRSLFVGSYKMQPFVRMVLVMLAEKARFFEFNEVGEPNQMFSRTFSSCLVGKGLIDYGDLRAGKVKLQDLEKLHCVINVNEPILEFKKDWLLNMKNVVVLYLGRWTVSATHHIEIEDDEEKDFLDGLKNMSHLRFFSLQGVSRIMELPESVLNLMSLTMLDLRACHNLESIPEGIGSLKNLTHLDMSECYLLEHMPKELSLLSELKVLKGFVVGPDQSKHFCNLEDLAKLENLIKLSIYTGLLEFPTEQDINALHQCKALRKLNIAWGAGAMQTQSVSASTPKMSEKQVKTFVKKPTFSKKPAFKQQRLDRLEKLDLKSFPTTTTPKWLMPSNLPSLEKLYIRGGKFSDLGQFQDFNQDENERELGKAKKDKWNIKILRLKYLSELEMDWRDLQELFPGLIYLEKVNCPKIYFFPCDGYGVWINKEKYKIFSSLSRY